MHIPLLFKKAVGLKLGLQRPKAWKRTLICSSSNLGNGPAVLVPLDIIGKLFGEHVGLKFNSMFTTVGARANEWDPDLVR